MSPASSHKYMDPLAPNVPTVLCIFFSCSLFGRTQPNSTLYNLQVSLEDLEILGHPSVLAAMM